MRLDSIQWISHRSEQLIKNKNKSNSSHIRKFVLSSYRVYAGLISEVIITDENNMNSNQNSNIQNRDQMIQEICLQNSILYRETFRTLLNDIDKVAEQLNMLNETQQQSLNSKQKEEEDQESGGDYSKQIDESIEYYEIIKNIEKTWHLCEILFLNPSSPMLSLEFMRWLKGEHEPLYLTQRLEDLLDNPITTTAITRMTGTSGTSGGSVATVESHVDFYPLLFDLTLHGKLETVYYLLTLHSRFRKLLNFYPVLGIELKRLLYHHPYAFYIDLDLDVDTLMNTLTQYTTTTTTTTANQNSDDTIRNSHKKNIRSPSAASLSSIRQQQNAKGLQSDDDDDDGSTPVAVVTSAMKRTNQKAIRSKLNHLKHISGTVPTRHHHHHHHAATGATGAHSANTSTQLSILCLQWREDMFKLYQNIISASATTALSVPEIALVLEVLCGKDDQALLQLVDCCTSGTSDDDRMDGDTNTTCSNNRNDKVMKYIMLQLLYKYTPPLHSQDVYHITQQAFVTYHINIHSSSSSSDIAENQLQLYLSSSHHQQQQQQWQCTQSQQLLLAALQGNAARMVKYVYEVMISFQQDYYQQLKSIHITTSNSNNNTNSDYNNSNNSNNSNDNKCDNSVIKFMNNSSSRNALGNDITMTLLQSCVHLCDLLSRCVAATDFTLPLPSLPSPPHHHHSHHHSISSSGHSNNLAMVTTTTANTAVNPSFLEELSLQLLEMLHELEYPTELIQGYGSSHSCPVQGRNYTTALLTHRHCTTDSQAMSLSSALEGYTATNPFLLLNEMENERTTVIRGNEVTKRGVFITDSPSVMPLLVKGSELYKLGHRRGIIRALYFFQLAHDHSRSQAILDRTLWSLCSAVRSCTSLFSGLTLYPDQPSQSWKQPLTTQQPTLKNKETEKLRFLFTLTDLSVYWSQKYWPSFYVGSEVWNNENMDILKTECKHMSQYPALVNMSVESSSSSSSSFASTSNPHPNNHHHHHHCDVDEFKSVLSFAQDILNSLRQSDTQIMLTDYYNIALSLYTKAIVMLVQAMTTFDQLLTVQFDSSSSTTATTTTSTTAAANTIFNNTTTHCNNGNTHSTFPRTHVSGISSSSSVSNAQHMLTADMMILLELCLVCMDSFQSSGLLLYDLLTSQSLPMRYWLCALELCTWIDSRARVSLEYIRKLNRSITATTTTAAAEGVSVHSYPHSYVHSHVDSVISSDSIHSSPTQHGVTMNTTTTTTTVLPTPGPEKRTSSSQSSLIYPTAAAKSTSSSSSSTSKKSKHTANNSLFLRLQNRLQNHGACIYTKLQSLALSHSLKQLETSYNHEFFFFSLLSSSSSSSSSSSLVDNELLRSLKLKLIGMYTAAVLQENADQGYKAYQLIESEKQKQHDDYLASKQLSQQQQQQQAYHHHHQQSTMSSSSSNGKQQQLSTYLQPFSFDC